MVYSLNKEATLFAANVAKEVKVQDAENPNQYFLVGSLFLDKEWFNNMNNDDNDTVHGFEVIYGPFDSKLAMHEFIAEHNSKYEWPGIHDWGYIKPGKVRILTQYKPDSSIEIVHNKTLKFQGQMGANAMKERVEEFERSQQQYEDKYKRKIHDKTLTQDELNTYIDRQKKLIDEGNKSVQNLTNYLKYLETLTPGTKCEYSNITEQ